MSRLNYTKGRVFDIEPSKGSTILHACNTQGVWGAGFAAELRLRYPHAAAEHAAECHFYGNESVIRTFMEYATGVNFCTIVCLMVSMGYGMSADKPATIVANTREALRMYARHLQSSPVHILSPRINSGLFRVPWDETEAVILEFLEDNPDSTWTVFEG